MEAHKSLKLIVQDSEQVMQEIHLVLQSCNELIPEIKYATARFLETNQFPEAVPLHTSTCSPPIINIRPYNNQDMASHTLAAKESDKYRLCHKEHTYLLRCKYLLDYVPKQGSAKRLPESVCKTCLSTSSNPQKMPPN